MNRNTMYPKFGVARAIGKTYARIDKKVWRPYIRETFLTAIYNSDMSYEDRFTYEWRLRTVINGKQKTTFVSIKIGDCYELRLEDTKHTHKELIKKIESGDI